MPESLLGDGLVYEDTMPCAWAPGPAASDSLLARLNADNQQLLAADLTLEEGRLQETLKNESPALAHELQRLDYKLNILLRVIADLAMRQSGMPPPRSVKFSSSCMEWVGADAPQSGATGILSLYVNLSLPQPLKIPAVVRKVTHGTVPIAWLEFNGLSEAVVDLIEKMIFRHHRRLVAGARLAPQRNP